MTIVEVEKKIAQLKVVPVVKIDNLKDTEPLMTALIKGGLPIAEITFRTSCAESAIKLACEKFPNMLVGAGTVVNVEQAERAVKAGAKFIVGPGWSDEVAVFCRDEKVMYLPGCVTPSEIIKALSNGIQTVKFFPAQVYGGLKAIKALSAPFVDVKFVPTGGVGADNLAEFLAFEKIVACGGSWMVADKLVKSGEFEQISLLCAEAVKIANAN